MGLAAYHIVVRPFTISTPRIEFVEWVTIFTIALAPLIAHIAAGTPRPSILTTQYSHRPKWHDSICLYNPTSILWRYAAILDRRIRARDWSVVDMAATNAVFWTATSTRKRWNTSTGYATFGDKYENGEETSLQHSRDLERANAEDELSEEQGSWNGTEEMILASFPYCTELPLRARAELLSWETIKTLIITLQGAQTLYTLVGGLRNNHTVKATGLQDGVDMIFVPFTVIGLFRLFAAGYLTSTGVSYVVHDDALMKLAAGTAVSCVIGGQPGGNGGEGAMTVTQMNHGEHACSGIRGHQRPQHDLHAYTNYNKIENRAAVISSDRGSSAMVSTPRYHSTTYIPSILFRCMYMLFMVSIWAITLVRSTPIWRADDGRWERSITTLLAGSFYLFFMSCTCTLCAVYFWRGGTRSTLIPCIGTVWYKAYTAVVFAWMVTIFVVACCETAKLPCGRYTSLGQKYWDGRSDCETPDAAPFSS